jgi:hypothetical protein
MKDDNPTMALLIEAMRQIKPHEIMRSILVFLSTVAPGVLVIFYYKPELIHELDVLKLIVLSAAITLPLIVVNSMIITFLYQGEGTLPAKLGAILFDAMLTSFFFLYFILFISWFQSLSFKIFVMLAVILELALLIVCFRIGFPKFKKHNSD